MVFGCNWPNCSKQFDDQKQYNEHLVREHLGEQRQQTSKAVADGNGTTNQQTTMMISKMENKKQICLPVETWVDILLCISRIELAKSVSLTNWLFNAISRPRIDEHNKRIVPPMRFYGWYELRCSKTNRQIPIAQLPPPINILGFKRLTFKYIEIDDQILEFMRLIKPILGTNVCLHVEYETESVHQLFNIIRGNVSMLAIYYDNFNLLDMEFLKTIQFVKMYVINRAALVIDRILEWLHSPLDENKPRYLFMCEYDINEMAEICKKRFLESTMPVSFVFHFDKRVVVDKALFSIENHQTGEQMTLGWYNDEKESYLMLCRSKIGDDQGWREVMQKANKCRSRNGNCGFQDYKELEEWREIMEKENNPDDNHTHLTHLRLRL